MLTKQNLGFRLGLLGLSIFTLGFALSELYSKGVVNLVGVIVLWGGYFLFGRDIQFRSRTFSLILGLFFLTLLPVYIWSYNSAYYTRADLVGITRSISPDKTVTLTFGYDIYSKFNPLPVVITDSTLYFESLNVPPTVVPISCKGGTLYPFGHLQCNSTVVIPPAYSYNFTGKLVGFNTAPYLKGERIPTASSLLYSQELDNFGSGLFCWNMTANAPTPVLLGPGPNYSFVC